LRGVRLALEVLPQVERTRDVAPDIARGTAGVVLDPEAGLELVEADVPAQAGQPTGAVDGVARIADLDGNVVGRGRSALGGYAGDPVVAGPLVVVVIDLEVQLERLGDVEVAGQVIQIVVAQDGSARAISNV